MTQAKEVKLGYGKQPKKVLKVHEINGLLKVLKRIEASNPKIDMKVDYWLQKNVKAMEDDFFTYLDKQTKIIKTYAETFSDEQFKAGDKVVDFIVVKGKDDTDTLLRDGAHNFKLVEVEGEKKLDFVANPTWELEVESKEEGKPSTKHKMSYTIKYKSNEDENKCEEELNKLAEETEFTPELWLLNEENLEGVNVVWADGKEENVSQFKHLLYDNLIR